MRKILLVALGGMSLVATMPTCFSVSAEESATQKYVVEFSNETVFAPAMTADNEAYTASLFQKTEKLENPLSAAFHEEGYVFTSCGEYLVRYTFEDLSSGGKREEIITLEIRDTIAPTIVMNEPFYEFAELGEQLSLPSVTANDLSAIDGEVSVQVFVGGEDVSAAYQNGVLSVEKIGEYTVIYSVADIYGNVVKQSYSFESVDPQVTQKYPEQTPPKEEKSESGCGGSVVCGTGVVAALIAFMARRKKA